MSNLKLLLHPNKPSNNQSLKPNIPSSRDIHYLPNKIRSKRLLKQPQFLNLSLPKELRCHMSNKFLLNSQTGIRTLSLAVKNSSMILLLPKSNSQPKHSNLPGTITYLRMRQKWLQPLNLNLISKNLHKWIFLLTMIINNQWRNLNRNIPQVKSPRHHPTQLISSMMQHTIKHHSSNLLPKPQI